MEHLASPLIVMAVFAWLAVDSWATSRAETARKQIEIEGQKLALETQKMEFEAQKLMLEKCQNSEEVSRFLASDAGKRFLERLQTNSAVSGPAPTASNASSLTGIIALVVFGALGTGVGAAFYLLSQLTTHPNFIIPAFLVAIPGMGLLIGAAVSYHLKKKWGLLRRDASVRAV